MISYQLSSVADKNTQELQKGSLNGSCCPPLPRQLIMAQTTHQMYNPWTRVSILKEGGSLL